MCGNFSVVSVTPVRPQNSMLTCNLCFNHFQKIAYSTNFELPVLIANLKKEKNQHLQDSNTYFLVMIIKNTDKVLCLLNCT